MSEECSFAVDIQLVKKDLDESVNPAKYVYAYEKAITLCDKILSRIEELEAENKAISETESASIRDTIKENTRLKEALDKYEYWLTEILGIIRNLYTGIPLIQKFDKEFSQIKAQKALTE